MSNQMKVIERCHLSKGMCSLTHPAHLCVSPSLGSSEELHAPAGPGVGSREWDQPGGGSRGLQRGLKRPGDARAHLHTCHPEGTAALQQWVWRLSVPVNAETTYRTMSVKVLYTSTFSDLCACVCVGVCRNLKSIVVQIGIEDYFEDPNSPEARKLFDEMVNKLQVTAPALLHWICDTWALEMFFFQAV